MSSFSEEARRHEAVLRSYIDSTLSFEMWLSDVTVISNRAFGKSVTLEVTVGKNTAVSTIFNGGLLVYNHKLVPTVELVQGTQVKVKVRVVEHSILRKILPNIVVQETFGDPAADFLYHDRKGHEIKLNVVTDPEPLQDLISISTEFTNQLETVLDRLGRGKQAVESGVTLVTAVGEFNNVFKAIAAVVVVTHQHLREQEKRDKDVKILADRIRYIFEQVNDLKDKSGPGTRLVAVISRGEELFRDCVEFTIGYCSTPAAARAFRASVQSKDKDGLEDLQRRLDAFRDEFNRQLLVHIVKALPDPSPKPDAITFLRPAVPAKPVRMLGRDSEANTATSVLLSSSPRLLILGDGGMGKTTLAIWSMHSEEVQRRYTSRLFVSCDGVNSLSSLINRVADVLRIPSTGRNSQLYDIVLRALAEQPRLLCLDNFETPWEDTASRAEVEDFLRHLHVIPDLALIVTMRGTERPALELPWSQALSPLAPLSSDDAIRIFEDILCRPADAYVVELIEAVACIPLAVTLVAALSQCQSSAELLNNWRKRGTEIVETSGTDRGSNLGVSISISVESRRMQENPQARHVLALIALLPDGLSTTILDRLIQHAKGMNIHKALSTLQYIALIQKEGSSDSVSRYQMLPPVRRWCIANLAAPEQLKKALYQTYVSFLQEHGDRTAINNHIAVKSELVNSEEVLLHASGNDFQHPHTCAAVVAHSHWSIYAGYISDIVLCAAIAQSEGSAKGSYLRQLARVHWWRDELEKMEQVLRSALELHELAKDVLGKADDLQLLGRLYYKLFRIDEAKGAFTHALELHRKTHDILGQAGDLNHLGHLLVYDGTLGEAEAAFRSAMALHEQVGDDVGKAAGLSELGYLYIRYDRLDDAEEPLTSALEVHKQSQDVAGQAADLRLLGQLHMRRDRLGDAEHVLESALARFRQLRSVAGEAYSARTLGDLYMRQNQLDEAEQALKLALELSSQAREKAIALRLFGLLYSRRDQLDEAETALKSAMEMYRQVKNTHGEADTLGTFGELEIRRGAFDLAEQYLQSALEMHRQLKDKENIGNDHRVLGQMYTCRNEFDKAEEAVHTALEIHRSTGDRYWERKDLEALAALQTRLAGVGAGRQVAPIEEHVQLNR